MTSARRWLLSSLLLLVASTAFGQFPETGIIDNFNRVDENPATGWTACDTDTGNIQVVSNEAQMVNDWGCGYRGSYGQDAEVYAEWDALGGAATESAVAVNMQDLGGGDGFANMDGYWIDVDFVSGAANDTWDLIRLDNGTGTSLANGTQEVTAGDSFGIFADITNTTITAYYHNGTSWSSLGSDSSESTYGTGAVLVYGQDSGALQFDDFGGGTVSAPSRPNSITTLFAMVRRALFVDPVEWVWAR